MNTDEQITEPVIEQPTVEEPVAQVVEAAEIPTITDVPEVLETTTADQVSDENEQSANA
jgi:hypothetical protein